MKQKRFTELSDYYYYTDSGVGDEVVSISGQCLIPHKGGVCNITTDRVVLQIER